MAVPSRYSRGSPKKIAYAIKEHNGRNPWEPDEIWKAIGAGTGGNTYFYLTAASRDYGLTIGTSTVEKIALTDLISGATLYMRLIQRLRRPSRSEHS